MGSLINFIRNEISYQVNLWLYGYDSPIWDRSDEQQTGISHLTSHNSQRTS